MKRKAKRRWLGKILPGVLLHGCLTSPLLQHVACETVVEGLKGHGPLHPFSSAMTVGLGL